METAAVDERRRFERLDTYIYDDAQSASKFVADEIAALIRERAQEGRQAVLGLATGSTPTPMYDELVRMHDEEGLSFQNVVTFNLDEYYPMEPDARQSYVRYMHEYLFDHVDIPEEQVHIPDGTLARDELPEYCRWYEEKIQEVGGLDIQVLGIGRTGHIGFNEPGSVARTRTRLITLDDLTRQDASGDFSGKENVPRRAITMGIATILDADRIFLMAWGEAKAEIIKRAVEGEESEQIPSTFLQRHDNTEVILDEAAAAELTRIRTPWLVGFCDWDANRIRKAVVWLCEKLDKPILKLTDVDYNENGMSDIVTTHGPAYNTNIRVFNELQHTITGWPGGKPNADDSQRPERAAPFPKRVLIFSPHPGDDVISMGGTLLRLVEHGHEVHVAYQTSGNISVFDEEVLRFADFVSDYHETLGSGNGEATSVADRMKHYMEERSDGDVDPDEVLAMKSLIRRVEAKTACRYCGIPLDRAHFLQMPFYETGRIRKNPIGEEDVQIVADLMDQIKPHQIYAAGDLSDPHGTHRMCMTAIRRALDQLQGSDWLDDCYFWLYRGAWQEWDVHEIEMAVPLSPDELEMKRGAIFKHETQKDRPQFPGSDSREFWVRTEERARATARRYDGLGLAEYEAMEAFVREEI